MNAKFLSCPKPSFSFVGLHHEKDEQCGPNNAIATAVGKTETACVAALRQCCGPNGKIESLIDGCMIIIHQPKIIKEIEPNQPTVQAMFA